MHVLKNGMIALITYVVAQLPLLILGSLLVENFFGIPGLGNLLTSAIQTNDFAVVRATTFPHRHSLHHRAYHHRYSIRGRRSPHSPELMDASLWFQNFIIWRGRRVHRVARHPRLPKRALAARVGAPAAG